MKKDKIEKEADEYFKEVDSKLGLNKSDNQNDIYASGKYSKVMDFFIGAGIYVGLMLILSLIGGILSLFMGALNNPFNQIMMIFLGLAGMLWIILLFMPLIVSLILAKKYFPERRLVRVGVWFMFLLPILIFVLLFGACLVAISNGGLGF